MTRQQSTWVGSSRSQPVHLGCGASVCQSIRDQLFSVCIECHNGLWVCVYCGCCIWICISSVFLCVEGGSLYNKQYLYNSISVFGHCICRSIIFLCGYWVYVPDQIQVCLRVQGHVGSGYQHYCVSVSSYLCIWLLCVVCQSMCCGLYAIYVRILLCVGGQMVSLKR